MFFRSERTEGEKGIIDGLLSFKVTSAFLISSEGDLRELYKGLSNALHLSFTYLKYSMSQFAYPYRKVKMGFCHDFSIL